MNYHLHNIGIIGYGAWGLALAQRYANSFKKIILCGRDTQKLQEKVKQLPPSIQTQVNHENNWQELDSCAIIIIATPSHAFNEVSEKLLNILKSKESPNEFSPIILLACKGLVEEGEDIQFLHQNLQNQIAHIFKTHQKPWVGALTGPSFAKEVALGLPCALTLSYDINQSQPELETQSNSNSNSNSSLNLSSSAQQNIITCMKAVQNALHQQQMRIYLTNDIIGCQIGGAFKNVIALASGVAYGLSLGLNAQAALITRGLSEMTRLAVAVGAQAQTMQGLAGLGDLVLTATGNLSRNRLMGELLAQNHSKEEALAKVGQVVESIYATQLFYKIKIKFNLDLPILESVHAILFENMSCTDALQRLIQRQAKEED